MKLKSLALIIAAFSFSSFAYADEINSGQTNHFYAGAGLGALGLFNNWHSYNDFYVDGASIATNNSTDQTGNANIDSTFLAGYAWYLPKNTFLGVEIFDTMTNASSKTQSNTITAPPPGLTDNNVGSPATGLTLNNNSSFTLQNVYGIRGLPGYQFNSNTVLYGIVGFARAHATSNAYAEISGNPPSSTEASNSSNFNGYQLGFGSMLNLNEHLSLRADMIFTMYGTQTLANQTITTSAGTNVQVNTTAKPSTLEGDISLVYMFG